jgi:hypothetical protein
MTSASSTAPHPTGTLTSYKQHSQLADFLQEPGEADITAHVHVGRPRAAERSLDVPRDSTRRISCQDSASPISMGFAPAAAGHEDASAARRIGKHSMLISKAWASQP